MNPIAILRVLAAVQPLLRRYWPLALVLAVFAGGVYAGRAWFPRYVVTQVDPILLRIPWRKIVEIKVLVPGPERKIEVPVIVERPGPERIITVTKPVPVPVEIIKTEWPQTITVRVGSVLTTAGEWVVPQSPDLVIGQVTPGVYAVSAQQPGWKVERVTTETKLQPTALPEPHVFLYAAALSSYPEPHLTSGIAYRNAAPIGGTYELRVDYHYPGFGLSAAWGVQW